ncbi:Hsp20/alpha crystallin family protein [Neobacillus muris]|uniref:Hsp20/alpha crystallin family protein n=1 Tax=Neobacillus muris TaxID=2941334 RepID=UPI00203B8CA3|nr:Hsp20/alpha crystallin family protein [Neobacillus muris]
MRKKKVQPNLSVDAEQMEQFLKNYFLDPLTSLADQQQFRIDIYETEENWIVEAFMDELLSSEITVKIADTQLIINAQKHTYTNPSSFPQRSRTIDFPFPIINHCVTAAFQNGVLEIFISKTEAGQGKNRYITLP